MWLHCSILKYSITENHAYLNAKFGFCFLVVRRGGVLLAGEHTLFRNQFPISAQNIKNQMAYSTITNYRLSVSEPITYTLCLSPGTYLIARPPVLSSSLYQPQKRQRSRSPVDDIVDDILVV